MLVTVLASTVISANTVTTAINLRGVQTFCWQTNVTAVSSPSQASVRVQVSNDNTNFVDLPGSSQTIKNIVTIVENISDGGYQYVRLSFRIASGTFTAEVIFAGRDIT